MSRDYDMSHLVPSILRAAPELDVALHGSPTPPTPKSRSAGTRLKAPWQRCRNCRLVHSIAAGVDNILSRSEPCRAVPLCRVVDPQHARGMSEFVTWGVLHFHRQLDRVMANQRNGVWLRSRSAGAVDVLGRRDGARRDRQPRRRRPSAARLHRARLGARRERAARHRHLRGRAGTRGRSCSGTDILVCLLPLTDETRGILDGATLEHLPPRRETDSRRTGGASGARRPARPR